MTVEELTATEQFENTSSFVVLMERGIRNTEVKDNEKRVALF